MTKKRRSPALFPLLCEVLSVTGVTTGCSHSAASNGSDSCQQCHLRDCDEHDLSTHSKDSRIMTTQPQYSNEMHLTVLGMQPHLLEEGLANMDPATLRSFVAPIYDCLATLDAEELLSLERTDQGGARLSNG